MWKSSIITALATMLSRALGLVRDILLATFLGSGAESDALFVALRIPNFFRRLFAEGAFVQVFVPTFSHYQQLGKKEALIFLNQALVWLFMLTFVVVVLGSIGSDWLLSIYARGILIGEKGLLASKLLKISIFYLLGISIVVLLSTSLQANRQFLLPAILPILFNLFFIGALLLVGLWGFDLLSLPFALILSSLVQALILWGALARLGFSIKPVKPILHEGILRMGKLLLPLLIAASAVQINLLISTQIASFLGTGVISYLDYADRLMSLPIGVIGVAIATVALPSLSRAVSKGDTLLFKKQLDWALLLVLFFGIPSALMLIFLGEPILTLLFGYGKTTETSIHKINAALTFFSLGIPLIMSLKVLMAGISSQSKVKWGMVSALISVGVNISSALLFVHFLGYKALALSVSLGALSQVLTLIFCLKKTVNYAPGLKWHFQFIKILFAAFMMGVWLYYITKFFPFYFKSTLLFRFSYLAATLSSSFSIFLLSLWLTHFPFQKLKEL